MTNAPARRRATLRDPRLVLCAAMVGAVVAYIPVLRSPFWLDDYIYLSASRDLGTAHYARLVFTPWSHDPLMPFTRDFWRPLAFLYFEAARPVFGSHVLPYHLVNLGIHLASVVLVWKLAKRLDPRPSVAGTAALVFALYPGSAQAVSWVSSVNSAGLPVMLGSWLFCLSGTRGSEPSWRLLAAAAGLLAVALMFRETSATLLAPVAFWFVLVQRRDGLRAWRTYLPLLPYALVCAAYYVVRTKLFTEPAANSDIYGFGGHFDDHWWYYIKNALLPFRDPVLGWRVHAQEVAGAILLASMPVMLAFRRWQLFALTLGLVVSIIPSAAAILGVGQRYFYFSTPVLAAGLGMVFADVRAWSERRGPAWPSALAVSPEVVALVLAVGIYAVWDRNANWVDIGPERQQTWVDELRAEYPALPAGGTLYCVNIPLDLAVFDAANLEPTLRWYYPEVGHAVWAPEQANIPPLGPDDRVFIAGDGNLLGDSGR